MQKSQSNYERIILALVALAAIGISVWLILMTQGFAETLKPKEAKISNVSEAPPLQRVVDTIEKAKQTPTLWVPPERNRKFVPLNKSVLIALKGEQEVDMFLEDPPVRPPMTNAYLRENNLAWQHPNVGDLDADGDGFNNLEEFEKQTKPKDARSHPPITDKLFMVDRIAKNYRITLRTASGQVSMPDEPKRPSQTKFVDLSKVGTEPAQFFGGDGNRFKVLKWEPKTVADPRLGQRDVSELTIEEIVTKRIIVLVVGVEQNLAEYSVVFEHRLKMIRRIDPVPKEGNFRIPGYEDTTYRVMDILEDKAVISALDSAGNPGPEIIIKKG